MGLREVLSKKVRLKIADVYEREELHQIADVVDEQPMSAWDLEMCSLHGWNVDEDDTYNYVLETVQRVRFTAFFDWLIAAMTANEKIEFLKNARKLQNNIDSIKGLETLRFPNKYK